ncbi:MAG: hypothetical protein PHW10_03365 [Candidatus Peribacteraceae bacterium]|nr:hypothetical protein [Candidatus Peribacteraceae bacterium]
MQTSERARALPIAADWKRVLLLTFFTILAVGPTFLTHTQWLTGPLVNATLLLTCALIGPTQALLLGLLPSTAALASGLLPLPLAPMVPFIMIGNALYIVSFHLLRSRPVAGIIAGSVIKFVFLASVVRFLMTGLLGAPVASKLAVMMGWPQLFTALGGGAVALVLLLLLPRRG